MNCPELQCIKQIFTTTPQNSPTDTMSQRSRQACRALTKVGCEEEQTKGSASGGRGVHVCYQGLHTRDDQRQAKPIPCTEAHCLHEAFDPLLKNTLLSAMLCQEQRRNMQSYAGLAAL